MHLVMTEVLEYEYEKTLSAASQVRVYYQKLEYILFKVRVLIIQG